MGIRLKAFFPYIFFILTVSISMSLNPSYFYQLGFQFWDYPILISLVALVLFCALGRVNWYGLFIIWGGWVYFWGLSQEYGCYPLVGGLLLLEFLKELGHKRDAYQMRNLLFIYIYSYLLIERLQDEVWLNGLGAQLVYSAANFQGFINLGELHPFGVFSKILSFGSLIIEFLLVVFFVRRKIYWAAILGLCLHGSLLLTTNITIWQLFLICYFIQVLFHEKKYVDFVKVSS